SASEPPAVLGERALAATALFIENPRLARGGGDLCRLHETLTHSFTGCGPGNHGETGPGQLPAPHSLDPDSPCSRACSRVRKQNSRAFGREMLVPPGEQRKQHGTEVTAALGEDIFIARWLVTVTLALQQTAFDQRVQPPGQHVRRDIQAFLEFVEPF